VAKEIFGEMVAQGVDPREVVKEQGLEKVVDPGVLGPMADRVLETFPEKAQEYRDGKKGLLGFFTGQVMKETKGKADPKVVQGLLRERLGD
jgi:Asp-tRNA(Asn)/Glu-tRNA(Gln) amidotransferase B subunit